MTIDAKQANAKYETREQASLNHRLADLIGISVARLMDDSVKYPSLKEAYPTVFSDLVEKKPQADWEISKMRMMQYMEANNKKVRRCRNDGR